MRKPLLVPFKKTRSYQRLLAGEPQTNGMRSGRVVLKSQESVGEHTTKDKEEVIVVLEGSGKFIYGEKYSLNIKNNSIIYVPPRIKHDVKNTGRKDLVYVYITTPVRSGEC